jgi:TetR/AcrR family transcriptional repressor of nem operon
VSRPRSFDRDAVVEAAKDAFWGSGYERTGLSDLEQATSLHRSSLYGAFGSKEQLFQIALARYIEDFVGPLLTPMEVREARARDVETFFRQLAAHFRAGGQPARHGCLWINSIAETAGRLPVVDVGGQEYVARLHGAFANALSGEAQGRPGGAREVERRARTLASATLGIWLHARVDPLGAALDCDALVAEMSSGPAGFLG